MYERSRVFVIYIYLNFNFLIKSSYYTENKDKYIY